MNDKHSPVLSHGSNGSKQAVQTVTNHKTLKVLVLPESRLIIRMCSACGFTELFTCPNGACKWEEVPNSIRGIDCSAQPDIAEVAEHIADSLNGTVLAEQAAELMLDYSPAIDEVNSAV